MTIQSTQKKNPLAAFDLKGSLFTLTVLRLYSDDLDAVSDQLGARVEQAPAFFQSAPIVIDLQSLPEGSRVDFALLVGLLRGYGLIPVGIVGGNYDDREMAKVMDLAILSHGKSGQKPEPPPVVEDKIEQVNLEPTSDIQNMLVTRPVRSGQRLFAAHGDLIVMAHVSSGAELLAVGNIHIYGQLRGRALAGVKGDESARIFCQNLNAELVSIAGHYKVNDDFADDVRAKSSQVYLDNKKLRVELLN